MADQYQVLIIEDNESDAELIQIKLGKLDLSVNSTVLYQKKNVFKAFREGRFDLIICDYNLPEFNGREVLKRVREIDPHLPFILMSGYIGEEKAVDAMLEGASDYVLKDNLARLGPAVERELTHAQERKKNQQDLKKMSLVARKTREGVMITDRNQNIEWVNQGFTEMTGYSLEDIKGKKPKNFLHGPDTDQKTEQEIENKLQNYQSYEGEILHYTKKGRRYWSQIEVIPIFNENGELTQHISLQKDITKQKLGQLMGNVHEMARIGGWEIDLIEETLNLTPSTRQLLEIESEVTSNMKNMTSFFQDPDIIRQANRNAILKGESYDLELKAITGKGKERWVRVLGKPEFRNGKCHRLLGSIQNINSRKEVEIQLQNSLDEKKTLLAEVHHRVKNNLAVVSGMLQLQVFEEDNQRLQDKLQVGMARIQTIANIHELLYQSESFSHLRLDENIKQLVSKIRDSFSSNSNLDIEFDIEPVQLSVNQAIPCSLIINEVFTNILKHAYPNGEKGAVEIRLKTKKDRINLLVGDDGVGLPSSAESGSSTTGSLGRELIDTLAQQLDATYNYHSRSKGTEFMLQFNKNNVRGIGNAYLVN